MSSFQFLNLFCINVQLCININSLHGRFEVNITEFRIDYTKHMSGWDSCNFGDRISGLLKSRLRAGDDISRGGASFGDDQPLVSSLQGCFAVASVDVEVVGFPLEVESIDGEGGSGSTGNLL